MEVVITQPFIDTLLNHADTKKMLQYNGHFSSAILVQRNHLQRRWNHSATFIRRIVVTTSGFLSPSWTFGVIWHRRRTELLFLSRSSMKTKFFFIDFPPPLTGTGWLELERLTFRAPDLGVEG